MRTMSENGEVRQEEWPSSPSRQRRHLLQGIFFLLGVGILMPWNAFISAKQYFESRQCGRVVVDKSIESTFAVVYNLAAVLCLGFIIAVQWIQDRQKQQRHQHHHHQHHQHQHHHHGAVDGLEQSPSITAAATAAAATSAAAGMSIVCSNNSNNSNNNRNNNLSNSGICASDRSSGHAYWLVMVPLAMYVMVFMLQTVLVLWIDIPPDVFRSITLASLIACGMLGSIAQAGIVATAGLFHSSIGINPFLAGQSAGGLAVSLCNFLAAALEDPSNYYKLHCTTSNDTLFETLEQGSTTASVVTWDHLYTSTHRAVATNPRHGEQRDDETCVPYTQKDMAVFSYFMAGSIVLVACLVGYYIIDRFQHGHHRDDYETVIDPAEPIQGNHHHHHHRHNNSDTNDNTIEHQSPRIGLEMNPRNNNHGNLLQTLSVTGRHKRRIEGSTVEEREEFHDEDHDNHDNHDENGSESSSLDLNETQQVWSIAQKPAACVFLVFFVTLGLFPGWVSQLRSTHECREPYFRIQNDLYTPAAFCLFNAGDFVGRILSAQLSLSRIRNLSNKLVMAAAVRVIFFPLFLLCVGGSRDGQAATGTTGIVIHSDFYSFMIQSGFALTNGLLLTTAFAHAPSLLANVTHVQERSSEILNFAVVFGLLIGSLVSVPIVHWFD